jgi:iron-sulfur cluster assembly accessory protein
MDNITLTERAARRIGEILRREPPGTMLRVSVEGGGCSGFQYKFDMDRAQAADDVIIRRDGATVLIDQISVGYLAGSEIDFVDDLIGASFRINNPQATASCGCGPASRSDGLPAAIFVRRATYPSKSTRPRRRSDVRPCSGTSRSCGTSRYLSMRSIRSR